MEFIKTLCTYAFGLLCHTALPKDVFGFVNDASVWHPKSGESGDSEIRGVLKLFCQSPDSCVERPTSKVTIVKVVLIHCVLAQINVLSELVMVMKLIRKTPTVRRRPPKRSSNAHFLTKTCLASCLAGFLFVWQSECSGRLERALKSISSRSFRAHTHAVRRSMRAKLGSMDMKLFWCDAAPQSFAGLNSTKRLHELVVSSS